MNVFFNLIASGALGALVAVCITVFYAHVEMKKKQTVQLFEDYHLRDFLLDRYKLDALLDAAVASGQGSTFASFDKFIMDYHPNDEDEQTKCRRAFATVLSFLEKTSLLYRNAQLHNAMFSDLLGDEVRAWLERLAAIIDSEQPESLLYEQFQRVGSLRCSI